MDQMIREALCGFVEDMHDRMNIDGQTRSRHYLMVSAERLAGSPDVPRTRAEAIRRFMRENGITFETMLGCESREESDQAIAEIHAERRADKTIGYMRALDEDLGDCISMIRDDERRLRHISAATGAAISRALHCLRADNLYICDGEPRSPNCSGPMADMEALHAENAAALKAFGSDDHLPEMLSSETRSSLFFVTQMVNANHLMVVMDDMGLLQR